MGWLIASGKGLKIRSLHKAVVKGEVKKFALFQPLGDITLDETVSRMGKKGFVLASKEEFSELARVLDPKVDFAIYGYINRIGENKVQIAKFFQGDITLVSAEEIPAVWNGKPCIVGIEYKF